MLTRIRCRRGFTLVEMLVVVGIIVVLIALLMPVVARARRQSVELNCAANLRSIGQALTMYVQQFGYYPSCYVHLRDGTAYPIWPTRLRLFTGGERGVFLCPLRDERYEWREVDSRPGARATAVHTHYGYEEGERLLQLTDRFSYGYNAYGTGVAAHTVRRERGLGGALTEDRSLPHTRELMEVRASRVKAAAEMIAIADSTGDGLYDFEIRPWPGDAHCLPGDLHRGGANVLFCDGHVSWYLRRDLIAPYSAHWSASEFRIRRMWNSDNQP